MYYPTIDTFFNTIPLWVIIAAVIWTVPWKGVALWRSARNTHKAWFVALLFINTLGILEILYLFVFSKRGVQQHSQTSAPSKS